MATGKPGAVAVRRPYWRIPVRFSAGHLPV